MPPRPGDGPARGRNVSVALLLAFAGCLIALLWGAVALKVHTERQADIKQAIRSTANLVRAVEEQAARTLREADQVLFMIVHQYQERGASLDLRWLMRDGPVISRIYNYFSVIDEHGELVLGSDEFTPANLADRDYFRAHVSSDPMTRPFISKPVLEQAPALWSIQLSRRINRPDLSFGGVAVVSLDPGHFAQFYRQLDLGEQGMATLVGRDAIVRAHRARGEFTAGMDTSKWAVFRQLKTADRGSYLSSGADGVPRIFSYRALADYPLVAIVSIAEADALAEFQERRRNYFLGAGAVTGVIVLFTAMLLALAQRQRALARDLTRQNAELTRAERSVRTSEERLRRTLDNTPGVAVQWFDRAGRVLYWNAASERLYGIPARDAVGRTMLDLLHTPDQYREFLGLLAAIETSGRPHGPDEIDIRSHAGVAATVIYTMFMVPGESGAPIFVCMDVDITERRRAESALAASERRYRTIIDNMVEGVVLRDADGSLILSNPAAERIRGRHPGDTDYAAMRAAGFRIMREDGSPFPESELPFEVTRRTGEPRRSVVMGRRLPDGTVRWTSTNSTPIGEPGAGAPRAVLLTNTDITERKLAEAALRASEDRFRSAMAHSAIGMALVTPDGCWMDVNPVLCGIVGYTRKELLEIDFRAITHPDDLAADEDYLRRFLGGELAATVIEKRYLHKDGRVIWVQLNVSLLRDARGAPLNFIVQVQDVTARRLADAALRESEARLRSMFHDSPAAQSVIGNGRYVDVNRAWCELTGYAREDVVDRTPQDLGLRNLAESALLVSLIQRDGYVVRQEGRIRRRSGEVRSCEVSGRRLVAGDRQLTMWWMIDITEQRRAQRLIEDMNVTLESQVVQRTAELSGAIERLQASQEALLRSEKLAALGRLVAGVAHELNTPIGNSLLSASTFAEHTEAFASQATAGGLRRSALDTYVAHSREAAAILLRNLHKAADLIVSFKQVSADQTSSQRRSFELDRVVEECLIAHRPTLRKTPITVSAAVPAGIRMDSYPGPLGQVIANLIHNAVIHGHEHAEGGVVEIRARQSGPSAELIVRDDGCGIAEDDLKRVFDPFFTTKMGRGGTGLGLPICHRIVTGILGGTITVESRHGKGTTVSLLLPLSAPTGDTPEAPAARAA